MMYVIKRIIRRPVISIFGFVLASAMCFFLCSLIQYRTAQKEELESVRDSFKIRCVVTDPRGVNSESLRLHKRYIQFVEAEDGLAPFVKDLCVTRELYLSEWFVDEERVSGLNIYNILGLSDPTCSRYTDPAYGGAYHTDIEDFFRQDQAVCLVPETAYGQLQGKTLLLWLVSPYTKEGNSSQAPFEFKVAGYYEGDGTSLLAPYAYIQQTGYSLSDTITVDSLSFTLNDNTRIDELKEKAFEEIFSVPAPSSYSSKAGLVIGDAAYRGMIHRLTQNEKRVNRLIRISLILSLFAGLFVGFLSARGETKTYALMRTLGVSGVSLTFQVLAEQLLLPALGILAVGIIMKQPATAGIYFLCYLIGIMAAVLRPAHTSPTELLQDQE